MIFIMLVVVVMVSLIVTVIVVVVVLVVVCMEVLGGRSAPYPFLNHIIPLLITYDYISLSNSIYLTNHSICLKHFMLVYSKFCIRARKKIRFGHEKLLLPPSFFTSPHLLRGTFLPPGFMAFKNFAAPLINVRCILWFY